MTCSRGLWTAAACLAVLTVTSAARTAPAPVERSGLDQVPASAPIVVHIRGAEGTRDRLYALMKNALPEVLERVKPHIDKAFEEGVNGRKLRGLVKNGPIFVVFTEMPKPREDPKVAVVLAVTNYTEFRDGVLTEEERKEVKSTDGIDMVKIEGREDTFFVDKKGYAVVSPNKEVAEAFTKKQAGLDGRLSKELATKLMDSDIGLYVSMDAFNKDYAEQIKQARKTIDDAIEAGAGQADKNTKGFIEIAKKMVGPVFQAVEDSQGLLLAVELRPTGLAIHAQTEVKAGSPSATFLQKAHPVTFKDLARMPGGRIYYTGLQASADLVRALGGLMQGVVNDPDSKDAKAVKAALDELAAAGPGEQLDANSVPPVGLRVSHFADPAKAVAAQLKLMKALDAGGTFQSGMLKEKPTIKASAKKYGDFDLNFIELVWDLDKMAEAAAANMGEAAKKQILEGLKTMLGQKLQIWFGSDGKVVVQVTAADWPAAEKLLDQYFKGTKAVGDVKAFRDVRKEMPAEATFLGLADVVQYLVPVAEVVKPLLGPFAGRLPPGYPVAPPKDKVTFVGVSVTMQPRRSSVDTFVSAEAAHEFYKAFIKPLMGE